MPTCISGVKLSLLFVVGHEHSLGVRGKYRGKCFAHMRDVGLQLLEGPNLVFNLGGALLLCNQRERQD